LLVLAAADELGGDHGSQRQAADEPPCAHAIIRVLIALGARASTWFTVSQVNQVFG
jgi:hypothetical protein